MFVRISLNNYMLAVDCNDVLILQIYNDIKVEFCTKTLKFD